MNVILFATQRCNLRCAHCFVAACGHELETAELSELFRCNPIGHITLTGGEPTLRPDWGVLAGLLHNLGIPFTLATNGTRHEEVVDLLARFGACAVQTSLDGREEIHNRIRGAPTAYRDAVALVDGCRGAGIPLTVVATLSKANYGEMEFLLEFARTRGVPLVFNFIRSTLSGRQTQQNDLSPAEIEAAIRRWTDYARQVGQRPWSRAMHVTRMETWLGFLRTGRWPYACKAYGKNLVIYANGDVARCEMKPSVCNLRETGYSLQEAVRRLAHDRVDGCYCGYDCEIMNSATRSLRGWREILCRM